MSGLDYRAMWEELRCSVRGLCDDAGTLTPEEDDGRLHGLHDVEDIMEGIEKRARTPDPDHVPAVRRVVAWVDSQGDHHEDCGAAYWFSAVDIISRAWFRCPPSRGASADEWWGRRWPWPRVHRLAAWLRRRDEEAGYR